MFSVTFSPDLMAATLSIEANDPDRAQITEEVVTTYLTEKAHVEPTFIDLDAIKQCINEANGIPVVVARGIDPQNGADGKLKWHTDFREPILRLAQTAQDDVSLVGFDFFPLVERNALIVSVERPERGVDGRNVFGRRITANGGVFHGLPEGKHVIVSPDSSKMYAARSGRLSYVDGVVNLIDCFCFNGNLSKESGKLEFDGDVLVEGNVLDDAQIFATGNIEVLGSVVGASIEAKGDIVVRGGISGEGKAIVTAEGSVFSPVVEYATVEAGRCLAAERISFSNVICGGDVLAVYGKGHILGGNVCAGMSLLVCEAGNENGQQTFLEVGTMPKQRDRLTEVERELPRIDEQILQLLSVAKVLPLHNRSPKDIEVRSRIARELIALREKHAELTAERDALKAQIERAFCGEIVVRRIAHMGCKISIGSSRRALGLDAVSIVFFRENGAIGHHPYAPVNR